MADIQLRHESVDQAVQEMIQATQQMRTNMEELLRGLQSMAHTFTGASADAWHQFQQAANAADNAMNNDFGQGHVVLAEMHNIHKNADLKGASVFHL
jgi:methyl-accepting chemotaxis protein